MIILLKNINFLKEKKIKSPYSIVVERTRELEFLQKSYEKSNS